MANAIRDRLERIAAVKTGDEEQRRRGRLLSYLLMGSLTFGIALTAINIVETILSPTDEHFQYLLADVLAFPCTLGLWRLNRRGRVRLTALIYLTGALVGVIVLFPLPALDSVFIIFALPITAASFIIHPRASLPCAILAALLYTTVCLAYPFPHQYDYVQVLILFTIALLAWLAAANLEENIAERRRSEEALRKSEATYRYFIEDSSDVVWQMDAEFRYTYVNPANEKLRGYSRTEIIGKSVLDFLRPETAALLLNSNAARLRQELAGVRTGPAWYEIEQKCKDGHYIWTELNVSPYRNAADDIIGYYGIFRDISKRRQAEETLRQTTRWMEDAERLGQLGGWMFDLGTGQAWATTEALRIYGVPEPTLTIARLQSVPLPKYRPHLDQAMKDLVENQKPYDVEFQIARPIDGVIRDIHSIAEYDPNTHRVLGVMQDVTGHKQAERALQESEKRFRELVNASPDAVLVLQDGKYVFANPGGLNRLGFTQAEFQNLDTLAIIHPEDRDRALEQIRTIGDSPSTGPIQIRHLTKSGGTLFIESSAVPITFNDRLAVLIIAHDISERKQAEERILQLNAELEQRVLERTAELEMANRELASFSYSVSHDLRTPLRSVDGFSNALLEDYGDRLDEPAREYLQRIRAGTQRMAELIDDLLRLAHISRTEMLLKEVDLSLVAQQAAAALIETAPDRAVEFVIAPQLTARADERLIRIGLENLLENAWKFTSRHPRARIEFGQMKTGGSTVFFVRDDGAGFDPAYANKLFGVFQRLHYESEFPGTGIGLATVQRIIQRHGGRIWAEGTVEGGATFYFTLAVTHDGPPRLPAEYNPG